MPLDSRISDAVLVRALPAETNLFAELLAATIWEDVGKGRHGAVLAKPDESGGVPLVRTTTRYAKPAQRFRPVHEQLAHQLQECLGLPTAFDNALIETYTNAYTTMGSHSDQALDLAEESSIAVFSCYQNPEAGPPRKLIFEPKAVDADSDADAEKFEIPLTHNSIVAFTVAANRRLKHKIVLDAATRAPDNLWLGVTFRTSKTTLHYRDGHPRLPDGARLTPATDDQQREFYQLRRRENNESDFVYPLLTYTISESDLLLPV